MGGRGGGLNLGKRILAHTDSSRDGGPRGTSIFLVNQETSWGGGGQPREEKATGILQKIFVGVRQRLQRKQGDSRKISKVCEIRSGREKCKNGNKGGQTTSQERISLVKLEGQLCGMLGERGKKRGSRET